MDGLRVADVSEEPADDHVVGRCVRGPCRGRYDDELLGREAIRAYMRAGFTGPLGDFRISGYALALRFVSDEVGVFAEMAGVLLPGETEVAPARRLRATWPIVRRAGRLSLMSFRASPVGD